MGKLFETAPTSALTPTDSTDLQIRAVGNHHHPLGYSCKSVLLYGHSAALLVGASRWPAYFVLIRLPDAATLVDPCNLYVV
jgi:hypothetical protein